jgi:hypothetical protein
MTRKENGEDIFASHLVRNFVGARHDEREDQNPSESHLKESHCNALIRDVNSRTKVLRLFSFVDCGGAGQPTAFLALSI